MLLLIDNFDSFTYNLVQYFRVLGEEVRVIRNDALTVPDCFALNPSCIVISPGPGNPQNAGISKQLIEASAGRVPLFGVCLGMQSIAEVFGGITVRGAFPVHGKTCQIFHDEKGVFKGIEQGFLATRYHSLVVPEDFLPDCLHVTARSGDGVVMGLRHRDYQIEGVQFHPESVLCPEGIKLLNNFLRLRRF